MTINVTMDELRDLTELVVAGLDVLDPDMYSVWPFQISTTVFDITLENGEEDEEHVDYMQPGQRITYRFELNLLAKQIHNKPKED